MKNTLLKRAALALFVGAVSYGSVMAAQTEDLGMPPAWFKLVENGKATIMKKGPGYSVAKIGDQSALTITGPTKQASQAMVVNDHNLLIWVPKGSYNKRLWNREVFQRFNNPPVSGKLLFDAKDLKTSSEQSAFAESAAGVVRDNPNLDMIAMKGFSMASEKSTKDFADAVAGSNIGSVFIVDNGGLLESDLTSLQKEGALQKTSLYSSQDSGKTFQSMRVAPFPQGKFSRSRFEDVGAQAPEAQQAPVKPAPLTSSSQQSSAPNL